MYFYHPFFQNMDNLMGVVRNWESLQREKGTNFLAGEKIRLTP